MNFLLIVLDFFEIKENLTYYLKNNFKLSILMLNKEVIY